MCSRFDGVTVDQFSDLMAVLGKPFSREEAGVSLASRGFQAGGAGVWFCVSTPFFEQSAMLPHTGTSHSCECRCRQQSAVQTLVAQSRQLRFRSRELLTNARQMAERNRTGFEALKTCLYEIRLSQRARAAGEC